MVVLLHKIMPKSAFLASIFILSSPAICKTAGEVEPSSAELMATVVYSYMNSGRYGEAALMLAQVAGRIVCYVYSLLGINAGLLNQTEIIRAIRFVQLSLRLALGCLEWIVQEEGQDLRAFTILNLQSTIRRLKLAYDSLISRLKAAVRYRESEVDPQR